MNTNVTLPKQDVSESAKKKPEYYIPTIDYIIDKAISLNDKSEVKTLLDAADGYIDNKTFNYALTNFGVDKQTNYPNNARHISIINPIKRRYIGEYIRQFKNFQVYHKDIDPIIARNNSLSEEIKTIIRQYMLNKMQEGGLETGVPQQEIPDLEQYIAQYKEDYIDKEVIEAQEILGLINALTDSDLNYTRAFSYWFACEEVYTYRKVMNNDLHKEIISPLEYYRIPSNSTFVEDDEQGMRKYKMSLTQIKEHLSHRMSDSDKKYLETIEFSTQNHGSNNTTNNLISRTIDLSSREEFSYLSTYPGFNNFKFDINDWASEIEVCHVVFRAPYKYGTLTYTDLMGEQKTMIVDETYKLNIDNGDIDLQWDTVPKVYDAYRIGNKVTGLYIKPELIQPQRQDINNEYKCKLPYNGISGIFNNTVKTSIVKMLIEYEALYRIYKLQQERAISQFDPGVMIIPESLTGDSEEMTRLERMAYAKRDHKLYIDDTDASANSLQGMRFVGDGGAMVEYIKTLGDIIDKTKAEAWEQADMNNPRMGDSSQLQGKAVTEYAINKATTGSILMFMLFNKMVEKDYEADIDYAKYAWIDGKQSSYIDPKTGKPVFVNIDGTKLFTKNLGIFVGNNPINDEKLQQFRQLAFSAAQNGEFGMAADSIELENSTQIHKLIKEANARKEEMLQQQSERQAQAQEQAGQMTLQNGREQREFEKYKIDSTNETDITVAKISAGVATNSAMIKANTDMAKIEAGKDKDKAVNEDSLTVEK